VTYIGHRRGAQKFWWGNLTDRSHLQDLGLDGRIISKYIFKK